MLTDGHPARRRFISVAKREIKGITMLASPRPDAVEWSFSARHPSAPPRRHAALSWGLPEDPLGYRGELEGQWVFPNLKPECNLNLGASDWEKASQLPGEDLPSRRQSQCYSMTLWLRSSLTPPTVTAPPIVHLPCLGASAPCWSPGGGTLTSLPPTSEGHNSRAGGWMALLNEFPERVHRPPAPPTCLHGWYTHAHSV
jgi:hypothetical protein